MVIDRDGDEAPVHGDLLELPKVRRALGVPEQEDDHLTTPGPLVKACRADAFA
jgi:hypothetical protein